MSSSSQNMLRYERKNRRVTVKPERLAVVQYNDDFIKATGNKAHK